MTDFQTRQIGIKERHRHMQIKIQMGDRMGKEISVA